MKKILMFLFLSPSVFAGTHVMQTDPPPAETRPLHSDGLEGSICGTAATCTIASHTGPGMLKQVMLALADNGGNHDYTDSLVNITVDGNLVLSAPIGLVFGTFGNGPGSGTTNYAFLSPNESLLYNSGNYFGGSVRYPIQFNSSLLVQTVMASGETASLYSEVDYYTGATPSNLYPSDMAAFHSSYTPLTSVSQYATQVLLSSTVVTNGPGRLFSIQQFMWNPSGIPGFLEGNPSVFVDASSYTYTGTEDFFCGQYYWAYGSAQYGPNFANNPRSCGPSVFQVQSPGSNFFAGGYRFFVDDPIHFNTSLGYQWINGQSGEGSAPGSTNVTSLITWFTSN